MASLVRNNSEVTLYDESSPLLDAPKSASPSPSSLPKKQLAALCSVRLVDPIAFTQVFPYINEFMVRLHVTDDLSQIGFYSGLVESSFAIAQLLSIYQWANLSDVVGRRPVIIFGTLGLALTTSVLGLSTSLAHILFCRSVAGLFSGNVAVLHSVLGEITDASNQALAFPIYGLFWPLGSIIGPLLGGTFSDPARKYPRFFDTVIFRSFPYLLPCIVASALGLVGAFLAYLFLDETLQRKCGGMHMENSFATSQSDGSDSTTPSTITSLLSNPTIRALSSSGFALCFIATAFDVVFVLFCYTAVENGGLAFSASQIGYSLATAGFLSASMQLLIMPTLLRTFDITKMYTFCMSVWPLAFLSLPFLNLIARKGLDPARGEISHSTLSLLWVGIAIVLGCSRVACLAYSVSMILIKENAPSLSALGRTNGLVQFAMCAARAVSPSFVSSAFAISTKRQFLGGNAWILVMLGICYVGIGLSKSISLCKSRNC